MGLLDEWLANEKDPDKTLTKNTVKNDRFDRRYYERLLGEIDDFLLGHEQLTYKVETGSPIWADLYWLLWKVEPEKFTKGEMDPSHLVNFLVSEQIIDIKDFKKLQLYCENNDVASALACIDLRETLERIFDKTRTLQRRAQHLAELLQQILAAQQKDRDVDDVIADWEQGHNPDEGVPVDVLSDKQAAEQALQDLNDQFEKEEQEFDKEEKEAKSGITQELKVGLKDATQQASKLDAQTNLWGSEDGPNIRMPVQARLDLAKKLLDKRFDLLLNMIGPMRRVMEEAQKRETDLSFNEVHSITMGDDLQRMLPSELSRIHHPIARYDFLRKYADKEVPQYELRGIDRVGKGDIICALDNSGSMMGDKEMIGKAIAACALHLARKQKRGFYGIHFSSANQVKAFDFGVDKPFSLELLVEYVEHFYGGGTDPMPPLSMALDRLSDIHAQTGKVQGDILFITDGIFGVNTDWLQRFKLEQERLKFRTWGFQVGGFDSGPMKDICDDVKVVKDIMNPQFTSEMFGQL